MGSSLSLSDDPAEITSRRGSALEVLAAFAKLGLTCFGGPIAHLGYFRHAFVDRRAWTTDSAYADIVAVCQFLPGPTSSQVGFAIGLQRAGPWGGLAAFVGFTTPSAILMFAAASGFVLLDGTIGQAVLHGLMLVAVSIVAQAVFGMARTLCRTVLTALIAIAALAVLLVMDTAWIQPVVIGCGALIGATFLKGDAVTPGHLIASPRAHGAAWWSAGLFVVLLLSFPLLAAATGLPALSIADAFYRSGALVFGGGHTVLPLLEAEAVSRDWIDQSTFLAGYGAAQALPGPLFTFAAYVGASSETGLPPIAAGALALGAIFLPGLLLVSAALPLWDQVKRFPRAVGFVRGANAAVVGVLAAALYDPVITAAIKSPVDALVAALGFAALLVLRFSPLLVVLLVATAGAATQLF